MVWDITMPYAAAWLSKERLIQHWCLNRKCTGKFWGNIVIFKREGLDSWVKSHSSVTTLLKSSPTKKQDTTYYLLVLSIGGDVSFPFNNTASLCITRCPLCINMSWLYFGRRKSPSPCGIFQTFSTKFNLLHSSMLPWQPRVRWCMYRPCFP